MPANAFSAPGPYCIAKTPGGLPFCTREQPSAMWTPTRSCRQITGRMPAATAASMIGVVGKQNSVLTPSRFRISEIASMTCIVSLPGLIWSRNRSAGAAVAPAAPASGRAHACQHPAAMRASGVAGDVVNHLDGLFLGKAEPFADRFDFLHLAGRERPLAEPRFERLTQRLPAQAQLIEETDGDQRGEK